MSGNEQNVQRLSLDMANPIEAGTQLGGVFLGSVLRQVQEPLELNQKGPLWLGVFASLAGIMSSSIGSENAELVLGEVLKIVAQGKEEEAAMRKAAADAAGAIIAKASSGLH